MTDKASRLARAAAPATAPAAGRRGAGKLARREWLACYLFIAPAALGLLLFAVVPIITSLYYSFTDYQIGQAPAWSGLSNYAAMAADPLFWQSLKVTVLYSLGSVPLGLAGGLALALLLNQRVRGLALWRTIYYLPSVLGGVPVALLWVWIFNPQFGLFNTILRLVGVRGPDWLGDPHWALPSLILMSLWSVGGGMIIYLAGLQGIPTDFYEAAEIDGAGELAKFRHVTLPLLTPVIFFNLITGMIYSLQTFTQGYVMTQGGPENATLFYVLFLYDNAFQFLKMGYASALAWILFAIIIALTLVLFRSAGRWVYYEGERAG